MANRRFGNNPGNQRGALRNNNYTPSSNINPWQGSVAPGNPSGNIQSQLALALTNLIQQTQQQTPDGPPSLLSMNTSPGFFNQDNQFNNQNRFGNRGRQDFRRNEPYNKNRGGGIWRSESNNRNNNRGLNNFSSKNRSNFRDRKLGSPAGKDKSKNDKKSIDKTPKQDRSATDINAEDRVEKDVKKDTKEEGDDGTSNAKRAPKTTKYDGLPNGLLHCFVCNKSMWDGESFQNHIGGKAHKQMISSLEESFQITVNILRENMRLCEERKMIEYERMQRSRRYHHNNAQEPESNCNMCDLKFMGKIVVHRQTEGHQRLKRFLHPKCKRCNLEFPSRMEWVDHQFAPDHLFKLKEYLDSKSLEAGEYKLKVQAEMDNEPLLEENVQNEDENPVLELSEDMANLFNRIPVFKPDRALAKESLKETNGFTCEICHLFMASEEDSQTHLKSYRHYQTFVEEIKKRFQQAALEKKKKAEEEAAAKAKEEKEAGGGDKDDDEDMEKLLDEIYDPFTTDGDGDVKDDDEENDGAAAKESTEVAKEDGVGENKEQEEEAAEGEQEEEEEEEEPKAEEEVVVVVEEKKVVAPVTTPNTRAKRGGGGGGVKNGAGPKSKKARN